MPLVGIPKNALLASPLEILSYLLPLLRNETPAINPNVPLEEWYKFISLLKSHNILPLFYWRIGSLPEGQRPPQEIIDLMREAFLYNRIKQLNIEKQLMQALEALRRENIKVLVLRGPALAYPFYPDPATRPSCDIDLLVLPRQVLQAHIVLENLGYKCQKKTSETLRKIDNEESFIYQDPTKNNLAVELHWHFYEYFGITKNINAENFFSRSVEVKTPSLSFMALCPIDTLIHCAVHLIMDHSDGLRLIWIHDIALVSKQLTSHEDWELLMERSRDLGVYLAVKYALRMAQLWIGLEILKEFNDLTKWPKATEKELTAWLNMLLRHKHKSSWFKVRWPKGLSLFETTQLFFYLVVDRMKKRQII